jgi:uncharacterized protein YkwD
VRLLGITCLLAGIAALVIVWTRRVDRPAVPVRPRITAGAAPSASGPPLADKTPAASGAPEGEFEEPPPPRPGETRVVELIQPPLEEYAGEVQDGATAAYAAIVNGMRRHDLLYDAHLGRAARDLAFQHSFFGTTVPRAVLQFLLRSSGAIDHGTTEAYMATEEKGREVVARRLEQLLASAGAVPGQGPIRVGIGEAYVPGARLPRFIGIILSRREVEIEPAPRRIAPGSTWTVSGTLPHGYDKPTALALFPSGELRELTAALTLRGSEFRLAVPVGSRSGRLEVSLGATGPFGPGPLFQVPIEVGGALPTTLRVAIPGEEGGGAEEAEARSFRLLNEERRRFGLAALARDPALDAVARAHSADMRGARFFGHRSPTTGDLSDRLLAARYRASSFAENVALSKTIEEAHAGLFESLGHRRNMLLPRVTRVGIGAVRTEKGRVSLWTVTQVFARPVEEIDASEQAARVAGLVNDRRRAAGVAEVVADAALAEIARAAASRAASGMKAVLEQAAREVGSRGGSWGWAVSTSDLTRLTFPREITGVAYHRLGIGIVQPSEDPRGVIHLVVLLAGSR